MKRIDLDGQRFGRWFVIEEAGINKHKQALWVCRCDCGTVRLVTSYRLRNGSSKSCGCLKKENVKNRSASHGMTGAPTYNSWAEMKCRCSNPNNPSYIYYGERGIRVCSRWNDFINFFEDMGRRPDGMTLERINNELGYFPGNCSWATKTQQSRNKRLYKNNLIGVKGISLHEGGKFQARIGVNNRLIYLGLFIDLEKAKEARKQAELKYWK